MSFQDPEKLLADAGWTNDRRVDVERHIAALEEQNFSVGSATSELISNIAALTIRFSRAGRSDKIRIDPSVAVRAVAKAWVDDYSDRVGTALLPMGLSNHEHLLLLVAEDGRWFGGFDDEFGFLGPSVRVMVDTLANDRGFQIGLA